MGICLVMKNNLKRSLRHKIRWSIVLIMPILLSLSTFIINQIQEGKYRIGVIDRGFMLEGTTQEQVANADAVCDRLNALDFVNASKADEKSFHTDLIMGTYHYIFDCTKGWSEEAIISTYSEEQNHQFYLSLENSDHVVSSVEKNTQQSKSTLLLKQTIGFLMSMFLIMPVLHGGMYLRDKSGGLITRYCYAPHNRLHYLIGNLCFMFLITFLQVIASFTIVCIVNRSWPTFDVSLKVIAFISIVASCFAIVICAICKNDTQASISASTIATILTIISGAFVSIESMPNVLQLVSSLSPIRCCMELIK